MFNNWLTTQTGKCIMGRFSVWDSLVQPALRKEFFPFHWHFLPQFIDYKV